MGIFSEKFFRCDMHKAEHPQPPAPGVSIRGLSGGHNMYSLAGLVYYSDMGSVSVLHSPCIHHQANLIDYINISHSPPALDYVLHMNDHIGL